MTSALPGGSETVSTCGAPLLKFGTGASDEIGYDPSQSGARRVLVVTDPRIAASSRRSTTPPSTGRGTRTWGRAHDHRDRAESTTICVLDVLATRSRPASATPRLRPTLAVVDPALTVTQPAGVTAASGMDILCHALESYTAKPYTAYDRKRPEQVKDFRPDGYPEDEPIVPHGMAVSLTAPEAFRFTFEARPERHLHAAELLAPALTGPATTPSTCRPPSPG